LGFGRDTCRTRTHDHLGLLMSRLICHSESRSTQNNRQPICFPRAPTMLPPASGEARLLFTPLSSRPGITSYIHRARPGPAMAHVLTTRHPCTTPIKGDPFHGLVVLSCSRAGLNTSTSAAPELSEDEFPGRSSPRTIFCSITPGTVLRESADGPPECDVALV